MSFNENLSSGSLVVACGRMHRRTERWTEQQADVANQIVGLRNFENAPKQKR
jgi:hypothetical protein